MVEDHPGDVLLIREALSETDLQFELRHFANGEEAVRRLDQEHHLDMPGLVLLDFLPRAGSWEKDLRRARTCF